MLGALLGAGASLVSSFLGKASQDKAEKNAAAANRQQAALARENIAQQREFAKHGLRWKVNDARKAGLHPLFALGAQTTSFNPVSVGSASAGDNGWYSGIAAAGQNLGRAIDAGRTGAERLEATLGALQLERAGLENDLLRSQIARINQPGHPPARPDMTTDGQGLPQGVSLYQDIPQRRTTFVADTGQEQAAMADTSWTKTEIGGLPAYAPQFSSDLADRMDENHIGSIGWGIRNMLIPALGGEQHPPPYPVPEGYDEWRYSPVYQAYRPYRKMPYVPFYY